MLILISGCDRTGKTTFAHKLEKALKKYNPIYQHFSYPKDKESAKKEYYQYIDNLKDDELIICDRFYECEHVYAPLYRGYQLDYLKDIETKLMKKTYVLFLYIYADYNIIMDRISGIGEDFVNHNDIKKVLDYYSDFTNKTSLPMLTLKNNTRADMHNNIDISISYISRLIKMKEHFIDPYEANLSLADQIRLRNNINNSKRDNIHKYFMDIANVVKTRSTCIKRKVGAVIVKNRKIISTGYNNPSKGLPNCTKEKCMLDNNGKCMLALHAEQNAIIQASPEERENAIMYVTCQPCKNCQLAILNSGITKVIYEEEHTPEKDFLTGTHVQCYKLSDVL